MFSIETTTFEKVGLSSGDLFQHCNFIDSYIYLENQTINHCKLSKNIIAVKQ